MPLRELDPGRGESATRACCRGRRREPVDAIEVRVESYVVNKTPYHEEEGKPGRIHFCIAASIAHRVKRFELDEESADEDLRSTLCNDRQITLTLERADDETAMTPA